MNKAVLKLAAFLLLTATFFACKEDPTLRDQLIGRWQSSKVVIVENNIEVEVRDSLTYDLDLKESLNYDLEITTNNPSLPAPVIDSIQGDWAVDEIHQFLTFSDFNGTPFKTWDVTSITDNQMTFEAFWESNTKRLYKISFDRQ